MAASYAPVHSIADELTLRRTSTPPRSWKSNSSALPSLINHHVTLENGFGQPVLGYRNAFWRQCRVPSWTRWLRRSNERQINGRRVPLGSGLWYKELKSANYIDIPSSRALDNASLTSTDRCRRASKQRKPTMDWITVRKVFFPQCPTGQKNFGRNTISVMEARLVATIQGRFGQTKIYSLIYIKSTTEGSEGHLNCQIYTAIHKNAQYR